MPLRGRELKPIRKPLQSGGLSRSYYSICRGVNRSNSLVAPAISSSASPQSGAEAIRVQPSCLGNSVNLARTQFCKAKFHLRLMPLPQEAGDDSEILKKLNATRITDSLRDCRPNGAHKP